MESTSKPELISTIAKQSEQLKRYETRLRDVVTAYKGLVKQKEALEVSLQAINRSKTVGASDDSLAALSLSLTTLTAEKTRMEEAFQADKKIAKENYESSLQEMRNRIQSMSQQHQSEVENLRAKLTFEMQEREKEYANHAAILKELQVKINSERKSKEKLEDKFVISAENSVLSHEMEKRVRDLSSELQATQRKLNRAEARTVETPQMLVRLQEKIALLQQGHSVALREEQIKAKRAEETARKLCASQEERVAMLEAKLAELSHTVGEYDLQRRKDQQVIQQLRENINHQILDKATVEEKSQSRSTPSTSETDTEKLADTEYLQNLIDKIHLLKQELLVENERLGSPIDVSSIFSTNENFQDAHTSCRAELQALRTEYDLYKRQLLQNNVANNNQSNTSSRDVEKLKSHVKVLQDKIEFMNMHLDEKQREFEELLTHEEEKRKHEMSYHQDIISELKSRILNLEKQLQNQRERYSVLLEETESYIRVRNDRARKYSGEENQHLVNNHKDIHGSLQEASSPPHMLHYAQEVARKDLDISHLRKDKHILEGQLRDSQRDATIEKVRYKEVVKNLKEEIDRLQRTQSREGANLEYLKNVVLSYLLSSDYAGRKHMLNAISAVLHFTESERRSVYKLL